MARYIDADEAIRLSKEDKLAWVYDLTDLEEFLVDVPTADVAPKSEVAREIFEEIEKLILRYYNDEWYTVPDLGCDVEILKKKYAEEKE